jgi:hypothetical protein
MTSVLFYEFLELSDSLFSGAKTASGHGNKSLLHRPKTYGYTELVEA